MQMTTIKLPGYIYFCIKAAVILMHICMAHRMVEKIALIDVQMLQLPAHQSDAQFHLDQKY